MAFTPINIASIVRFNSALSNEFLESYNNFVDEKIQHSADRIPHQTFAPSACRCMRKSWFRIRGVEPDKVKHPDKKLNFSAEIGTACHRIIQSNLAEMLKENWIDVEDYLKEIDFPYDYTIEHDADSLESRLIINNPPITFACDGILRLNGKYVLLEIKTAEFSTWSDLTDPKDEHIDQIKCYAALLNLDTALVMYQDRQYGELKCYEMHISERERQQTLDMFKYVLEMVEKNLAPEGLPVGDKWCSEAMCPYYKKCQEYGRLH